MYIEKTYSLESEDGLSGFGGFRKKEDADKFNSGGSYIVVEDIFLMCEKEDEKVILKNKQTSEETNLHDLIYSGKLDELAGTFEVGNWTIPFANKIIDEHFVRVCN